jgi:tetratricopeptide (TPR) repeat protein
MGETVTGFDAWCEACQTAQALPSPPGANARCGRCGTRLAGSPRFVELWGMLQQLDAVLAAWDGDAAPLATLLPERPAFLTDLTPPVARGADPEALRVQLAKLARGDWASARAPAAGLGPRGDAARAIACERTGDREGAIAAWDAVLAAGEDPRARLARGSLLARAGRRDEALADLARAGESFAARWNRAALLLFDAAGGAAAVLDATLLARARAEAGEPSAYWSDPTVGRLLWSRLIERACGGDAAARRLLHAAEPELEHDTFWDRALLLVGWVRVGAPAQVARVAVPLARREANALAAEPALGGVPLADVAAAVSTALRDIDAREPARARRALAGALAREDLRRFRLPCARCGRGSIGVDEVSEGLADGT